MRISKVYEITERQDIFILDLMKMDIPNLLRVNVKSDTESDVNVEKLFIDMVSTFIQNNGLGEVILQQIPAIMVRMYAYVCIIKKHYMLQYIIIKYDST